MVKVTRVAFSHQLNVGKLAALTEQARRLGGVRCEVWQRYGSVTGATLTDRQVRDRWMAEGTHVRFGVLANPWKETVRDAMADIRANREAAKVKVRRAVNRRTADPAERKRLFTALKADRWADDPFLARLMRRHWVRGKNHTHNQVVVRVSGVVWQADHAAAINVLARLGDPDITLFTPHQRVKQILLGRADRQRIRLPIQDSSPAVGAESEPSNHAHT